MATITLIASGTLHCGGQVFIISSFVARPLFQVWRVFQVSRCGARFRFVSVVIADHMLYLPRCPAASPLAAENGTTNGGRLCVQLCPAALHIIECLRRPVMVTRFSLR